MSIGRSRLPTAVATAFTLLLASGCGSGGRLPPGSSGASPRNDVPTSDTTWRPNQLVVRTCKPSPTVFCFPDTAWLHSEPGDSAPSPGAHSDWIAFGARGDSVDIEAFPSGIVTTSLDQERSVHAVTASYFRHRLSADGLIVVWVDFEEVLGDSLTYTFELHHEPSRAGLAFHPTGARASLILHSRRLTDRWSVVPLSLIQSAHDPAHWSVPVGTYNVALLSDSLYQICHLPCTSADTVALTPSRKVTLSR